MDQVFDIVRGHEVLALAQLVLQLQHLVIGGGDLLQAQLLQQGLAPHAAEAVGVQGQAVVLAS